jgi:LAS superfamily LD-carboxypeptidase LdcB
MPDQRLSSRGRHRAPAAPASAPTTRRLRGKTAKGALALSLVLALGGYTFSEMTTQRVAAATEQTAVAAAAHKRAVITEERASAVVTAQAAVSEATVVQTSASGSMSKADLAPLADAVATLNGLIDQVPVSRAAAPAAAGGSTRASRGVTRGPAPSSVGDATPTADPSAAPTADPSAAPAAKPAGTDSSTGSSAAGEGSSGPAGAVAKSDTAQQAAVTPTPVTAKVAPGSAFRAPAAAGPSDKVAVSLEKAAAKVAELTAKIKATSEANMSAAKAAAAEAAAKVQAQQVVAAKAKAAADLAAQKAAQRRSVASYANGMIPASALCDIKFAAGETLRCDAADALAKMDIAYKAEFGNDMTVTDSYRSYASQVSCSITKGTLCAVPGQSNHGLGVAVDLGDGIQSFGARQHEWMLAHAGDFGWTEPDWASPSGSKPEPWHWEFTG